MHLFEKWRKSINGTELPKNIECQPSELSKRTAEWFEYIDDKKIIRNNTLDWYYYVILIIGFLLGSYSVFFEGTSEHRGWIIYVGTGLFLIIAIYTLIYAIFSPKKNVIFDRLNGKVTIGGPFWIKPKIIPFKEVKVFMRTEYTYLSSERVLNIYRPDLYKQNIAFNNQSFEHIASDWAFFLWYMDKTRELPPGEVLDPYRIEDAKRRQRDLNSK
ncbi:MAG: hypothetical protein ACC657_14745 [Thiohalomonadales bacterium]